MDTSHCHRHNGFILFLVVFHAFMFSFASKTDVSYSARGIKIYGDRRRSIFNSNDPDQAVNETISCSNHDPDPGPITNVNCGPEFIIAKIDFAEYGNPTGKCGNFKHGNCRAPGTMRLVKKNCLGKKMCVLIVSDEMFGPSKCKGAPMLAVTVTCAKRLIS